MIVAAALAIIAVLMVCALALVMVVRSDEGPVIDGPTSIVAGNDAVYTASFDGADAFRWTDPDDRTVPGSSLTLSGVIPGDLMLEVVALDESGATIGTATRTIEVVESPNGPRIVGPDRVATGSTATYTVETDQEGTVRWVDDSGTIESPAYEIEPTREGTYRFSVVVSSPDGVEIGSTKEIEIIAP